MSNRGVGRGRMFFGGILLAAAAMIATVGVLLSPHGSAIAGDEAHVRTVVATFIRNAAAGTLILSALAAYLLFPRRRPRAPRRDIAVIALLAILVASSIYQLVWIQAGVLD